MGHLENLKIVAQQQKRTQSKTEHRRLKLLEKLDEQLDMVQALIDGEIYTKTKVAYVKNEGGQRVLVEKPKRVRPWYWMSGAGGCYFQVWYGSKVIELKPGMTAVQVSKREELPAVIRSIIDAVRFGELDVQIEDVAERNKEQLRKPASPKLVKKAS
jgi:hypothetical protein